MNEPAAPDRASSGDVPVWDLRLYIMGPVPKSLRAVANLKRLCEESLDGHCDVQVIDLTEHPSLARSEDIIATPTLIRYSPKPLRRVIGDLSDTERVLARLWS